MYETLRTFLYQHFIHTKFDSLLKPILISWWTMLLIPAHPDSCAAFLTFLHRRTRWERGEELLPQIRASFKKFRQNCPICLGSLPKKFHGPAKDCILVA